MVKIKNNLDVIRNERLKKITKLIALGEDPFSNKFSPNIICKNFKLKYNKLSNEDLNKINQSSFISGRIIAIRIMGKISFMELQDRSGRLQLFLSNKFKLMDVLDIGDFIGVQGTPMRTKTEELTLRIISLKVLTKALRPLPEKFHGLRNIEQKYRFRYLDLILDSEVRNIFINRSKIINYIQKFFNNNDFIEVETPILMDIPGGAVAKPFLTHHNFLNEDLSLRIATELYLKRLIIGGFERVFEIGRIFRNEGVSSKHNPEFTTIEFYKSYSTYEDLMVITENLVKKLIVYMHGMLKFKYKNKIIDASGTFRKVTIAKLIAEHFGFNSHQCKNLENIDSIADALSLINYNAFSITKPLLICLENLSDLEAEKIILLSKVGKSYKVILDFALLELNKDINKFYKKLGKTLDNMLKKDRSRRRKIALHLLYLIFENKIEHTIIQPTFITGFSVNVSPLARKCDFDDALAERFEFFCGGMEIANAFSELTDPVEQRLRFQIQSRSKKRGNQDVSEVDESFLVALETGMPPTAGEGIGIDRLIMLLTDSNSIKDVILFPKIRMK